MKLKTVRYKSCKKVANYACSSVFLNKLMWGEPNWKFEDLVYSALNYINQRILLKSRNVKGKGKSSSLYDRNHN